MVSNESFQPKWRIGFYPGPPEIRMEEEEGPSSDASSYRRPATIDRVAEQHIEQLLRQRASLIESMDGPALTTQDKFKLLEDTRLLMLQLSGGYSYKFASEKIIYAILIFSALVIVVLALLTAFSGLPKEVAITFVGTVVGGTIATIAQKLGKVGR